MARIIKVRCNGPKRCVNEVDIDRLAGSTPILKSLSAGGPAPAGEGRQYRDRYVQPCAHCTQGKVVVTRQMIEEALGSQ